MQNFLNLNLHFTHTHVHTLPLHASSTSAMSNTSVELYRNVYVDD